MPVRVAREPHLRSLTAIASKLSFFAMPSKLVPSEARDLASRGSKTFHVERSGRPACLFGEETEGRSLAAL
ncbi:MAG: hypothetical protein ACTHOH_15125, partial [Lysobacteraceae bacterium]